MELHVAKNAPSKTGPDALVRAIKRSDAILSRMIATETYLDGSTAYAAGDRPHVPLANMAMDVRVPPGSSAGKVLDAIDGHFRAVHSRCDRLDASDMEWPIELVTAIESRGYSSVKQQVYLLTAYAPPAEDETIQTIPGRAAYGELQTIMKDHACNQGADAQTATRMAQAAMDQLDDPRIDVFLARRDRKPIGVASVLTLGNIGVVLDLFATGTPGTHDGRGDTQATISTLAVRMFDHCLRAQFEQVIIRLRDDDARLPLFASLGFTSVAGYVSFQREQA